MVKPLHGTVTFRYNLRHAWRPAGNADLTSIPFASAI